LQHTKKTRKLEKSWSPILLTWVMQSRR
jgi:hypothetical protein